MTIQGFEHHDHCQDPTALSRFNIPAIFVRRLCAKEGVVPPWIPGGRVGGSGLCIVLPAGVGAGTDVEPPELEPPEFGVPNGMGGSEVVGSSTG
jgi:hypothetical protein